VSPLHHRWFSVEADRLDFNKTFSLPLLRKIRTRN
jgi:hypothetical protein